MNLHVALLCVFLASAVVGKPQISFGEEEEEGLVQVNPEEPAPSEGADIDDELIQTRLGLLAGYLSKFPFFNQILFHMPNQIVAHYPYFFRPGSRARCSTSGRTKERSQFKTESLRSRSRFDV